MPVGDHLFEIAVRRCDKTDIHLLSPRASQSFELLFLEDAKQLRLQLQWNVADLVQKERALVGEFKTADPLRNCAGECTSSRGRTVRFPAAPSEWRRN